MNLTRALIPAALSLITGWSAPALAETYVLPAYAYADGLFVWAGSDDSGVYHYDPSLHLDDWGYLGDYAVWYQSSPDEPIRGMDHGISSTFTVTWMPPVVVVTAVHDAMIVAPPQDRSGKRR